MEDEIYSTGKVNEDRGWEESRRQWRGNDAFSIFQSFQPPRALATLTGLALAH